MGERVRQYGIGLVTEENDSSFILSDLDRLSTMCFPADKFEQFEVKFSKEALKNNLKDFIEKSVN
jgi:hypothetical protein